MRRPWRLSLLLLVMTVVLGLAVRFAPLGFPRCVVKYGGSMLWAAAIYWLVSTLLGARIRNNALLAGVLATAVEFFKLCHWPAVEAFRATLAGVLLLGRVFSWWDIAAYGCAIALAAALDARFSRPAARV
jgi:hypothetical protein